MGSATTANSPEGSRATNQVVTLGGFLFDDEVLAAAIPRLTTTRRYS